MAFNFKLWIKGLYAAAFGGAVGAVANVVSDPDVLGKPKELATMAGVGAAVSGLMYLKTHPPVDGLPDELEPLAAAGVALAANKVASKLPKPKP